MDEFEAALIARHGNGHDLERGIAAAVIAKACGLSHDAVMDKIFELQGSGRAYLDPDANGPRGRAARLRARPVYLEELGLDHL